MANKHKSVNRFRALVGLLPFSFLAACGDGGDADNEALKQFTTGCTMESAGDTGMCEKVGRTLLAKRDGGFKTADDCKKAFPNDPDACVPAQVSTVATASTPAQTSTSYVPYWIFYGGSNSDSYQPTATAGASSYKFTPASGYDYSKVSTLAKSETAQKVNATMQRMQNRPSAGLLLKSHSSLKGVNRPLAPKVKPSAPNMSPTVKPRRSFRVPAFRKGR